MFDSTRFIIDNRYELMTDIKIRRFAFSKRKKFLSFFFFVLKKTFFFLSREKTRSLLVNVFRTRRSNIALSSNEVCEIFLFLFFVSFSFLYFK